MYMIYMIIHQEWLADVTHHDDASWLFRSAHAHNGSHADGGALKVNPTEEGKQEVMWQMLIYSIISAWVKFLYKWSVYKYVNKTSCIFQNKKWWNNLKWEFPGSKSELILVVNRIVCFPPAGPQQ